VIAFAVGLMVITVGTVSVLLTRHWTPASGRLQPGRRPCPRPGSSSGTIRSAESKKRRPETTGA